MNRNAKVASGVRFSSLECVVITFPQAKCRSLASLTATLFALAAATADAAVPLVGTYSVGRSSGRVTVNVVGMVGANAYRATVNLNGKTQAGQLSQTTGGGLQFRGNVVSLNLLPTGQARYAGTIAVGNQSGRVVLTVSSTTNQSPSKTANPASTADDSSSKKSGSAAAKSTDDRSGSESHSTGHDRDSDSSENDDDNEREHHESHHDHDD